MIDNGQGISPDRLDALNHALETGAQADSVGLHNIYQRLLLMYNRQATLTLTSKQGHWTKISLVLPLEIPYEHETKLKQRG